MAHNPRIINHTKNWLETIIISHGLCPFAKREYDGGTIHYEIITEVDLQSQLEIILAQCDALSNDAKIETCLLIFPDSLKDFSDYLDLVEISEDLLRAEGYEGIYQLASFHPRYRFDGADETDPSNYTNRSPYPMLHILREASIEQAIINHPNPESIPQRNIELTTDLGLEVMTRMLAACRE